MKYFLDMGAHKLEGLREFSQKLGINKEWNVYSFEPNIFIQEDIKKNIDEISQNYKSFQFFNKAVMDRNGTVSFNCHKGAWKDNKKIEYIDKYTTGANALSNNPQFDIGNGFIFDIAQYDVECISIDDILMSICTQDQEAQIWIKCDIEGSEFVVIPRIISSIYSSHIKEMYIEWHERMWYNQGQEAVSLKLKEKQNYLNNLQKLGIICYNHH